MAVASTSAAGGAWYAADRSTFLSAERASIVAELAGTAASQGWHIEAAQHEEWVASVGILHEGISETTYEGVAILKNALRESSLEEYSDVILEYDFRRRGLRIDCVLLAPGVVGVVEFKRSKLTPGDADQVTNYCVNLVEFHEETRRLCANGAIVVPILVQTAGPRSDIPTVAADFHAAPWSDVLRKPLRCDRGSLCSVLKEVLDLRRNRVRGSRSAWLGSRFSPSSTILDAAVSLFGAHDVSAINEHAGPVEQIRATVEQVAGQINEASAQSRNRIVLISGAPGAGKTLVGLQLAFDPRFRDDAVFVTGNAPLVDVLTEALKRSYRSRATRTSGSISGYPRESARILIENAVFKIVKAHNFLGDRGRHTASSDGRVIVFDEAQRTYEKGRVVLNSPLADHEADLILESLERSYDPGAVVVALLGQDQTINRGERGAVAWLDAAVGRGWDFAISDESLAKAGVENPDEWARAPGRIALDGGHLSYSLRFYRNRELERWADCVMSDDVEEARTLAGRLASEGHQAWITRDLDAARAWARQNRVGNERAGIIASGQARRLAAEGLFVDYKPSIAQWMLAPSGDVRSSNILETVQNQYMIQGLELDYTIVCWDADLRRGDQGWAAWKMSGARWQRDRALDVAKNGYRVLLTRARAGMIVFVPEGDPTGEDETRDVRIYDQIASHLVRCGAQPIG